VADILDEIFTADSIERLRNHKSPSEKLIRRIDILTAKEDPKAELCERIGQRVRLAYRTAWASYVAAMRASGTLDADVLARLTGPGDADFRSAMSECLTCHLLSQRLRLNVFGRPGGRSGKVIDFGVRLDDGDVNIEVKSPFAEKPNAAVWVGDHAHHLEPTLDEANKQFAKGQRNVLALVPFVEFPVFAGRADYVKAFLGETKIEFIVNTTTGQIVGEPQARFVTEGRFLKLWPEARFTRVGAVLAVRESFIEENYFEETFAARVELRWFVIHNPHSPNPVPVKLWGDCPQLIRDGENIRWTDGWSVDGSPPPRN
jgi:hypothetical protein